MTTLATHVETAPRPYTGGELRSLFAYQTYGIQGDSCVAFVGECRVEEETMVDLEDVRAGAFIYSREMLHLIAEHFEETLTTTVLRQRYLIHLTADLLRSLSGRSIEVRGDDLFVDEGKLSVSIATSSPISGLIHVGLNVTGEGAPVQAAGLEDLAVPAIEFARKWVEVYARETASVIRATRKVRWVR